MIKYVKDVFDIDEYIEKGINKIFLISGVCSGKSTYVTEVLAPKWSVLYITSRIAKVKEDATRTCFKTSYDWLRDDNRTIMTNAKLGIEINNLMYSTQHNIDEFLDLFDFIVIDEIHSMATDSTFAKSSFELFSFIEYVSKTNKNIIAMTGTPEPVEEYFKAKSWAILDFRKKCNYVHPKEIRLIQGKDILTKIKNKKDKFIYFSNHVSTIPKLCSVILKQTDIKAEEIAIIVAEGRLTEVAESLKEQTDIGEKRIEQIINTTKNTYDNIINYQLLPDECRLLISTSTLREGVDIKNKNITMFCENHILSNLIQFFGRVRGSANTVYIIENSKGHIVKPNNIAYEFAQDLVPHENQILKERFIDNDIIEQDKKYERIAYITNSNPYIFYDNIHEQFNVFHMKYREENRLLQQKYWKRKIKNHCYTYNIRCLWFDLKEQYQRILTDLSFKSKCKFYTENQNTLLNIIRIAYGIKDKQIKKINKALEIKKADIRLKTDRDFTTKSNNRKRGGTYWTIENIKNCTDFLNSYNN